MLGTLKTSMTLYHVQLNEFVCHGFIDVGGRQETRSCHKGLLLLETVTVPKDQHLCIGSQAPISIGC